MEQSMRGSSLSHVSYEVDRGDHAPVQLVTYECPEGHKTTLTFAAEIDEIPVSWECACGATAALPGVQLPEPAPVHTRRSHYEIVRERRTENDLAQIFVLKLHEMHDVDVLRSA